MKKYIIIFLLISTFFNKNLHSQDAIGGEMYVQYNYNTFDYEIELIMYRIASMGVTKNTITINDAFYSVPVSLSIFKDTIITPNIRRTTYRGSLRGLPKDHVFYYTDSVPGNFFQNYTKDAAYLPIEFFASYNNSSGWPLSITGEMPRCYDEITDFQVASNGKIIHDFDCYDREGDSMQYYLLPHLAMHIDTTNYDVPTANNYIGIDANGRFEWNTPTEEGWYLFYFLIRDSGSYGNHHLKLIYPIEVTASILTNNDKVEYPNHLQVFPNPTTDQLTIKFDYFTPNDTQIQIFDITGRMVHQQQMTKQSHQVLMRDFSDGVYVVRVQSGNKVVTRKVIKN